MGLNEDARTGSQPFLCAVLMVLVVLGYVVKQVVDPVYAPCVMCEHTGRLSCGAPGCSNT